MNVAVKLLAFLLSGKQVAMSFKHHYVNFHPKLTPRACVGNLGLVYAINPGLARYLTGLSEPREILIRFFVLPADVRVNNLNEFLNGCGLPVPRVEQLRFQPPEEAFTGCIIR